MGLSSLVTVTAADRRIKVTVDTEYMEQIAELDGCYALKTDLPPKAADAKPFPSEETTPPVMKI